MKLKYACGNQKRCDNGKQSLDLHIIVEMEFVIYEAALDEKVMRLSRLPLSLRDDRFKILRLPTS